MGRKSKNKLKTKTKGLGVTKPKIKRKSAKLKQSVPAQQYSVEDLLTKVDECVDSFQYELACKFCERALEYEPDNVCVLDTYAPLLLETGNTNKAVETFKQSIDLCPDKGHAKYLYLGQLSAGEEAISLLTKGIQIMSQSLDISEGVQGASVMVMEDGGVTRDELSNAYCSLAEVYLTDACFADDAGTQCYQCCNRAIELSPSNPDAYQLMTNCLLSQQKLDEARTVLMKGVALWLPSNTSEQCTVDSKASGSHDQSETVPAYFSRVNTAKLLLELQEFDVAQQILEGLLHDDDEVVSVWYLMGWLYTLIKDADSARFYLEQAQTLFTKVGCDEVEILEHVTELLSEVGPGEQQQLLSAEDTQQDGCQDDQEESSPEEEDEDRTSMDVS